MVFTVVCHFWRGLIFFCHSQCTSLKTCLWVNYRSFSLSHHKKVNLKSFNERSLKKMIWYKRLTHKQLLQISGLFGTPFLSYLPKRFTQLYRALYGDAILVYLRGTPIWQPEINKNIWNSLLRWKHFLFACELVYMHINVSPNNWNV